MCEQINNGNSTPEELSIINIPVIPQTPIKPEPPVCYFPEHVDSPITNNKNNSFMKEIQQLYLSRLQQEEALGFYHLVSQDFKKCTHAKFAEVLTNFLNSITRFDEALKPARANVRTAKLGELDHRRDEAWRGLAAIINVMTRHTLPAKAEAAQKLSITFNKYGDPTTMPYTKENAVIENLLQDLDKPEGKACLAAIDGTTWVDELKVANNEFVQQFYDRGTEQAEAIPGLWKEVRIEADAAYSACVKRLNALTETEGHEGFADIIKCVNERIDYQKTVLASRNTHNKTKREKAQEAQH